MKTKNCRYLLLLLAVSVLAACSGNTAADSTSASDQGTVTTASTESELTQEEKDEYKANVSLLTEVEPEELETIIESSSAKQYVYFGRVTCPACRMFVSELHPVLEELGTTVLYLDTEDTKTNETIQNIREKYEIEFVPSIIEITDGEFEAFVLDTEDVPGMDIDKLKEFLADGS